MQVVGLSEEVSGGGFLSLAKHDLSATLRTVASLVDFVVEDLGDQASADTAKHLEMIAERAAQMDALVAGLVAYEQASKPPAENTASRVSLNELISDVCSTIQRPDDVALLLDVDPLTCIVDVPALSACLIHLVTNAVQHRSRPSGFVRISVSHSRTFIEILIEDDGVGIPADHISVACEPLRKLPYEHQSASGNGLGLAIVNRIASAHNGQLRIGSREAIGTTVRLSWPTSPNRLGGFQAASTHIF